MNADYQQIREDLSALGLRKGDAVLIHSSFKSMGAVEGGIQTLVDALLSVIGDTGTLIVPTLTFVEVSAENRVFDYLGSVSCVGAVSEFVRQMDGAKRSINPTHSCAAIGYKRDWYVGTHQMDRTPVGPNSPIYKLHADRNNQPPCHDRVYDYLWIGEAVSQSEDSVGVGKDYAS